MINYRLQFESLHDLQIFYSFLIIKASFTGELNAMF
jgi:hypothetical protein